MLEEGLIKRVLTQALEGGGDVAEVFVEERASTALKLEDSRVEDVISGREAGAGVRVITGDGESYAYTNLLTAESLLEAARAASAASSGKPVEEGIDLRRERAPVEHPVVIPPGDVDAAEKVDALRSADEVARSASGDVRQVVASYMDVSQHVLVASSDGRLAEDDRTRTRFAVQVIAARGDRMTTGFRAPGHSGGFELLRDHPAAEIASSAAEKAVRMLEARPSPAGRFPVVLAPGTGGVLIHEACGHGLEADALVKEASVYAKREGERFGSDQVVIVDDATQPAAWGSFAFDDEGMPAQRTVLFDAGVLVGHLNDRRSAVKMGRAPTGNGRRQSYAHVPVVRMTNTNLLPGADDPDEILRSVKRGVFAGSFAGGEVNPATGNFVFGIAEGYMIEDGEIAYPVRGANLIGNGPEVLGVIDAIGHDFETWEGVCGKDGQHAPVTNGQATVLLGSMTVGGTEA